VDLKQRVLKQWDRIGAWILALIGAIVIIIGWSDTAGTPYPAEQLPYLISAGIGGALLVGFGAALLLSAELQQVADLVAVYGKRAVYANSVYGVGPTTASKILAKMQDTEKEFLNDLFEAAGRSGGANIGDLTKVMYDNASSSAIDRDYQALIFQSTYRARRDIRINGDYTLQLRNNGNFDGEAANQPGIPSIYGDYQEILGPAMDRYLPEGRLADYQRHKLRLYGTYSIGGGPLGVLDISPIWRVNSGRAYSLTAGIPVPAAQLARNPGYDCPGIPLNPGYRRSASSSCPVKPGNDTSETQLIANCYRAPATARPARTGTRWARNSADP